MEKLLFEQETYKIIGAAMEVSHQLGGGFLEAVYQESLAEELFSRKIKFIREKKIPIYYKGKELKQHYKADFICYENIILEIKAVSRIQPEHQAQIINYLRALNLKLGLILNFGNNKLEYQRIINKFLV